MTARSSTPGGSLRRTINTASFGTRLFLALTVVVLGCAVSAWIVASALAPGIFHDHLGQAGIDHNSNQAHHVEEAFTWAIILAWGLAIAIAVLLSLAVSWYIARRVQRSLTAVTTSTAQIAAGRYDTRMHSPGLGREFDDLTVTVNEVARRLEATETTRRRMLADLGHEMRTPIATFDSYLEALEDGVRSLDEDTLQILRAATQRLDRLAQDITAVSRAEEHLTRIIPVPTDTATLITAAGRLPRLPIYGADNRGLWPAHLPAQSPPSLARVLVPAYGPTVLHRRGEPTRTSTGNRNDDLRSFTMSSAPVGRHIVKPTVLVVVSVGARELRA